MAGRCGIAGQAFRALVVVPLVPLVAMIERAARRDRALACSVFALHFLAVAGGWLVWNLVHYGEWLALDVHAALAGQHARGSGPTCAAA